MYKFNGRACRALGFALLLLAPRAVMAQEAAAKTQVGVVTLSKTTVPVQAKLPGRAVATELADIRPRVDGVVTAKLYQPGAIVSAGDPLFQLDDASYQATVAADAATLASAQADLPVKQAAYDRAKKLEGSGYTADDVDSAKSALASAQAALQSAQAALKFADIQLGWTTIRSPINGVVDVADVSVGDLVTSGQTTALTTVTTLDPIEVDLSAPAADMLAIRDQIDSGALTKDQQITASLTLDNGDVYSGAGTLVTPSSTVSTTTGAVNVRFEFDNPERKILPGMFLRATVTLGTQQAFLVPQRAGSHDANGMLSVFIVGQDGTAQSVSLATQGSYDNSWIVTSGLDDGVQVVVDGQKNLQAGAALAPTAVQITSSGTTQDIKTASEDAMTDQTSASE
ncbi:hypothetical protein BFP70_01430 [Thioclava sp. SK-1]|uniref:efflux RND transporter periplasmic adaptor subunit n=1 Tax=Thioclava sp. SK-1 TaxID=1889770 RepID=UPI000824A6C9|nr:efflux RND transporter periplasmic adaptor subunit [Thioclava sp. SK-1]OCX61270.1 hypothetical protein BFP70_01430 [Thioclava sp. SK-1]